MSYNCLVHEFLFYSFCVFGFYYLLQHSTPWANKKRVIVFLVMISINIYRLQQKFTKTTAQVLGLSIIVLERQNWCSKCPPRALTHARRRWRHCCTDSSITH